MHETASLTRVPLGSEAPGEEQAPTPHDWMRPMASGWTAYGPRRGAR